MDNVRRAIAEAVRRGATVENHRCQDEETFRFLVQMLEAVASGATTLSPASVASDIVGLLNGSCSQCAQFSDRKVAPLIDQVPIGK